MKRFLSVTLAALLLATAGCGGGDGARNQDDTLNIALSAPPNTLDPAKIDQTFVRYINLAYDPVIVKGPDGTMEPGLAESWRYVGSGNKRFELTLRSQVKFSDGSPLTARAVKQSLEYQKSAGGQAQPFWAGKTITVTGPRSLRITSDTPDPVMPLELSQDYLAGNIISPKALEDPKRLGTTTAGTGPYVLDRKATVSGERYVYTRNPLYWNKSAVHYRQVIIRVIPNPNSVLNALKTDQIDVALGDYTTATAAEQADLQVKHAPLAFYGLNLMDRGGTVAPPLRDMQVRQALNYAVDREAITAALFGKYGTPTEQTVVPGQDGALDEEFYTYDPAKAKQLLAEAGYSSGFTLPVVTTTFASQSQVVQAIAGDLQKVGVKLQLTVRQDATRYISDQVSKRFPAAGITFGGLPIYVEGPALFLPNADTFNPFGTADRELSALYDGATTAGQERRAELDQEIEHWLVSHAWFVPVTLSPVFYFAQPDVAGVEPSAGQPMSNPAWWHPQ